MIAPVDNTQDPNAQAPAAPGIPKAPAPPVPVTGAIGGLTPGVPQLPMATDPLAFQQPTSLPTGDMGKLGGLTPGNTASDIGGAVPPAGAGTVAPPYTPGVGNSAPGYTASNIDPNNALLNQVITPGPGVDRYKQAQDALENYRKGTEPGYKADINDISAQSFGLGRGVSGQNRTRLGDLALARENDVNTKGFDFLNQALTGSIGDAYNNIGLAERQQGFQKGLSDTATEDERQRALLEDQLVNSDFGRNLSRETAGYANGPEQYQLALSKIFGDQSSAAGQAAAQAFKNAGGGSGNFSTDDFLNFIQNYKPGQTPATPPGGYVDDTGGGGVYG